MSEKQYALAFWHTTNVKDDSWIEKGNDFYFWCPETSKWDKMRERLRQIKPEQEISYDDNGDVGARKWYFTVADNPNLEFFESKGDF